MTDAKAIQEFMDQAIQQVQKAGSTPDLAGMDGKSLITLLNKLGRDSSWVDEKKGYWVMPGEITEME